MDNNAIGKFIESLTAKEKSVTISFRKRIAIKGLFIKMNDYEELKAKNFWRIVPEERIEQWRSTKNAELARLFNGTDFTRLKQDY